MLALLHLPAFAQQADAPPVVEEPTEAQIFDAYEARIAEHQRALTGASRRRRRRLDGADSGRPEKAWLQEIDRVGVHFDCRVELRMKQAQRRPKTEVVQLWLSYEDGAWIAR